MKIVYLILLVTITITGSAQNCNNPISSVVFQQKFNQMATKPSDQMKYSYGSNFVNVSCLTSNQIKLMASMFAHDSYRLEFCKIAYSHTMDQINFYDVYDAFSSFSAAFRLHDFVNSDNTKPIQITQEQTNIAIVNKPISFPPINYPSYANYSGDTGCDSPMSEADFSISVKPLFSLNNDADISLKAIEIADNNCLSMSQMMKIASIIKLESKRLETMREMVYSVYDLGNYTFATALFSHVPYQKIWLEFCESEVVEPPCTTTNTKYFEMLKQLGDENFPDDRLVLAKQILDSHCFSIEQIKGFMKKFNFGERRLKVAKAGYDNCTAPKNYYQLSGLFDFSSDKKAFNSWLDEQ